MAFTAGRIELSLQNGIEGGAAHTRVLNLTLPVAGGTIGNVTAQGFHPSAFRARVGSHALALAPEGLAGPVNL